MEHEFKKFPKIPRLHGLYLSITEKIDGTNAQLLITYDEALGVSHIKVGSRNRWITPGKGTDNYGFAAWVEQNAELLRRLGPGRHYGEWWGVGIGRNYGQHQRFFSLFDVDQYRDGLPDGLAEIGVRTVPVLYRGEFSSLAIEQSRQRLVELGSVAVPGWMDPEGLVLRVASEGRQVTWKDVFNKEGPSPEEKPDDSYKDNEISESGEQF